MIHEESKADQMAKYPFFVKKLKKIQKLCKKGDCSSTKVFVQSDSHSRLESDHYQLGNITWDNNLISKLDDHQYPSDYFIKAILCTFIFDNYFCNIPLEINHNLIPKFSYIPLQYNKLLIFDALWKQGSQRRYVHQNKYLYSEHSGVISIKNKAVDEIIVLPNTERVEEDDTDIFLPSNTDRFNDYYYMFHTHPNSSDWGGRLRSKIVYEFPSASDIFNFASYYDSGKTLGSLIVSPEGLYVIRTVRYVDRLDLDNKYFEKISKLIGDLESQAYDNLKETVTDPDSFHEYVSSNICYIDQLNNYLRKINLYIEYYPRIKVNEEWHLKQIYLQFIKAS